MPGNDKTTSPIIIFDGKCDLCNHGVQFVIAHDKTKSIQFVSAQSGAGKKLMQNFDSSIDAGRTVVFIRGRKVYTKTGALLRIATYFGELWPLSICLLAVPPFIRNAVYDFVSGRRYEWFGEAKTCMIHAPDIDQRFLG